MSDFRLLQTLGLRLRNLLFNGMQQDADLASRFTSENTITLDAPLSSNNGGGNAQSPLLSLYLYRVAPDPHLNNVPHVRTVNNNQLHPPLSLILYYLLTPMESSPETNLVILGRAMQILAANTILQGNFLESDLKRQSPEATLIFDTMDMEEMTRLWSAFNEPYRLSAGYRLQGVSVDTLRTGETYEPVVERILDVNQIVGPPRDNP